jgi:uncharacterized protein (DUF4415 family)
MAKGFFSRFTRLEPVPAPEPDRISPVPPPAEATTDVAKVVRQIARLDLTAAPRKEAISLRLDAEVLDWFRARGPGYQTRINAVLRAYKDAAG